MLSYNDRVTENEVLGGIVSAVAARARAMTPEFDPGGFLEGLSGQLKELIPHHRMTVLYLDEGGRTVSVFAEHASGDAPRHDGRYTLSLARASRYRIAEVVSSCVFAGQAEFVQDAQSDARCMAGAAVSGVPQKGLRSWIALPLIGVERVIGALIVGSTVPDVYTEAHLATGRQIANVIGPVIESVVLVHSERRRRQGLRVVPEVARVLGTSLDVAEIFDQLAAAVRPVLDFDIMAASLIEPDGMKAWVHVADAGSAPEQADRLEDYSFTARAMSGESVMIRECESELDATYPADREILGQAPSLREALARAAQVAPQETPVLLTGESGTGKELVAQAIHYASRRADGPCVAINCAALPEALIESELFGHERGAFTGADRQKPGRFELAAGGTLFLDEVGELAAAVQAKLLRVLQEREFQRVGGTATLKADFRLIVATNRNLTDAMARGQFREDLYYRLSVFPIHLPPLRERGEDVVLLAQEFVRRLSERMGKGEPGLSRDARELLVTYPWPGNIRELQNAIERALIVSDAGLITAAQLGLTRPRLPSGEASPPGVPPPRVANQDAAAATLQELERHAIADALAKAKGNKTAAAAALGITRMRLYTKLRQLRLTSP